MQNEQCVHVVQHSDAQLCTALCKWKTSFVLSLYSCYNSSLNQIKSTILLSIPVLWILRCFRVFRVLFWTPLPSFTPCNVSIPGKGRATQPGSCSWSAKWCTLLRARGFGVSVPYQGRGSSDLTQASLPQVLHKHPIALSRQETWDYPDCRAIYFLKNSWFVLRCWDATFLCTNVLRRLERDGRVQEPLLLLTEQHRRCVNIHTSASQIHCSECSRPANSTAYLNIPRKICSPWAQWSAHMHWKMSTQMYNFPIKHAHTHEHTCFSHCINHFSCFSVILLLSRKTVQIHEGQKSLSAKT